MARRLTATWLHDDRPLGQPTLDALLTGTGATVIDGSVVLDGDTVDLQTGLLAGALADRGLGRGDTIAWQAPNCWQSVLLYRAAWRLGAVAAPLHHLAGPGEVAAMLARLDPALVVGVEDVEPMIVAADAAGVAVADDAGLAEANDLAVLLHSSGSSGEPKGVLHEHAGLAYKAQLMIGVHQLTPDDVILMPAPLAHVSGLQNGVTVAGAVGMTLVFMAKWNPDTALDLIEEHGVTFMIGPPTFFVSLRAAAGFHPDRVASIRLISCGGAGVTPAFVADTAEAFGAVVKRTYGSTEAPTVTTSHAGDDEVRARETDGRPTGPVLLRLGPGDELWVRGPELFVGYTDPERTKEAVTEDGWFRTEDVARIDDDGWLTIVGRIKDLIIRGGENISAAEVEGALEAHPAVLQAVAVGEPDERLGERVCAFVVCAPGQSLTVADCVAWFAERGIARFKTPERVEMLAEFPLLPAGKIDRALLRAKAAQTAR